MKVVAVKIWGETVGALSWNDTKGWATFQYERTFRLNGWELSPFKLPLLSSSGLYTFPEMRKQRNTDFDTFRGLPGMFADVLPDQYGNRLIDAWLALQGRPPESMNPVEMLAFIGSRGMGALEFEPTILQGGGANDDLDVPALVEFAQKILSERSDFNTNFALDEGQAMSEILKIGTSAGGARPKAVIAYNAETGEVRSGQTTVPSGFGHWLIKLDGVSNVQLGDSLGYGRVEMAYYRMAKACGIDTMPSRLLEENGRAHFMTQRFDRETNGIKHHIQTFCGLRHFDFNLVNSFSYEQLFQTMRELRLSYAEAAEQFRRMAFNVIARNCDDHTKNFAFRMKKGENWQLAPAYDLCHAYKPDHRWVSQHALSINGKRQGITKDDLLEVGRSIRHKKAGDDIALISDVVGRWSEFAEEESVKPSLRDEIDKTLLIL